MCIYQGGGGGGGRGRRGTSLHLATAGGLCLLGGQFRDLPLVHLFVLLYPQPCARRTARRLTTVIHAVVARSAQVAPLTAVSSPPQMRALSLRTAVINADTSTPRLMSESGEVHASATKICRPFHRLKKHSSPDAQAGWVSAEEVGAEKGGV